MGSCILPISRTEIDENPLAKRVSALMDAPRLAEIFRELIKSYDDCGLEPALDCAGVQMFVEAGVLTNNDGLVVTLGDGSEYQVTVVQSRGAAR